MTGTIKRLGLGIAATAIAASLVGTVYVAGQSGSTAQEPRGGGQSWLGGRGGPGGPGGPMGRGGRGGSGAGGVLRSLMLPRLDLTDAQKERVKGIVDARRDEMKALGDRAITAHAALEAAISGETFDEATVRTRAADVAAVDTDAAVHRARVYNEVYQILTPEQQTKLKQIHAQMRDRQQNRQERRGQRGRGSDPR
jgi:protein CpxP